MTIEPELHPSERDALLLLRTMVDGEITFSIQDSLPVSVTILYPGLLNRKAYSIGTMTPEERHVLDTVKFIRFGKLSVRVVNGTVKILENDTHQQLRLGKISWADWKE